MKKLALFMVLALAGCATSPVSPDKAKSAPPTSLFRFQVKDNSNNEEVTVIRDKGFTGSGCAMVVFLDGYKSAQLETGEKATFYISKNVATIGVGLTNNGLCSGASVRTINISHDNEKPKLYRIGGDASGFYISPFVINEGED